MASFAIKKKKQKQKKPMKKGMRERGT